METFFCDVEFKADGDSGIVSGYAAVTGNVDRGGDIIEPGAFKGISAPFPMLREHNPSQLIGLWSTAEEKPKGLFVQGQIDMEDIEGKRAHRQAKGQLIKGLSIGYQSDYKTNSYNADTGVRTINKIKAVYETSLVAIPMNPRAGLTSVKGIDTQFTPRAFERFLMAEKKMSAKEAKSMAFQFKQFVLQLEAGDDDEDDVRDAIVRNDLSKSADDFSTMLKSFSFAREAESLIDSLVMKR